MSEPDLKQNRGCLGCFTGPKLVTAVDEPSKGLKIQGQPVKKSSVSEDFWSTSTIEMENSGVQCQTSISSTSASNHALDPNNNSTRTSNPHEFVNNGKFLFITYLSLFFCLVLVSICYNIELVFPVV